MKRVELLEALYLQGKKMRELQVYYFSLRKGGGRFTSPEAKKVLAQSKLEELQYDKMVKELDEWWEKYAESPLAETSDRPNGGTDLEAGLRQAQPDSEVVIPEGWMEIKKQEYPVDNRYVDVLANNGQVYKDILFDLYFHYDGQFLSDDLHVIAWTYSDTLNDKDDDIRI